MLRQQESADDNQEKTRATNAKIGEVLPSDSADHTSQRDEGVCWRKHICDHLTDVVPVTRQYVHSTTQLHLTTQQRKQ